jgi:hypothetical protein
MHRNTHTKRDTARQGERQAAAAAVLISFGFVNRSQQVQCFKHSNMFYIEKTHLELFGLHGPFQEALQ